MFHSFPYLHMIAVRDGCQNQGAGGELLRFFEEEALRNGRNPICTKVFLTVGDFNPKAAAFYRNRGYKEVFTFENLFRKGIAETLLTKIVTAKG